MPKYELQNLKTLYFGNKFYEIGNISVPVRIEIEKKFKKIGFRYIRILNLFLSIKLFYTKITLTLTCQTVSFFYFTLYLIILQNIFKF